MPVGRCLCAAVMREVYADRCPSGYALAGDHARMSRAEYERDNQTLSGDD